GALAAELGQLEQGARDVDGRVQHQRPLHLGRLPVPGPRERGLVEVDEVDLLVDGGQRRQIQVVAVARAQHRQPLPTRLPGQLGQQLPVVGELRPAAIGVPVVAPVDLDQVVAERGGHAVKRPATLSPRSGRSLSPMGPAERSSGGGVVNGVGAAAPRLSFPDTRRYALLRVSQSSSSSGGVETFRSISPTFFCAAPFTRSTAPSASSFLSPVTAPAASLTRPFRLSNFPLTSSSFGMCEPPSFRKG